MLKPWNDDRLAANGCAVCENFGNWFSASVVINQNSEPQMVFHGTRHEISEFVEGATWFTKCHDYANEYATGFYKSDAGGNLVPAYLSIQNPMLVSSDSYWVALRKSDGEQRLIAKAKKEGHDGIMVPNFEDNIAPADMFIVFDRSQIKSAIGNSGLFSKNSLSMTDHDDALTLDNASKAKVIIDEMSKKNDMNAAKSSPGEGFVGFQPGEPIQLNVPGFISFSVIPQKDRSVNFSMTAKADGSLYFSSLRLTIREDGTPKLAANRFETLTGKSVRAKANAKLEDLMDGAREAALSWANELATAPVSTGALNAKAPQP